MRQMGRSHSNNMTLARSKTAQDDPGLILESRYSDTQSDSPTTVVPQTINESQNYEHPQDHGLLEIARTITRGLRVTHSKTLPRTSAPYADVDEFQHHRGRSWWNFLPSLFVNPSSSQDQADTKALSLVKSPIKKFVGPQRGEIESLLYTSVDDLRRMQATSDHRPVKAVFALGI